MEETCRIEEVFALLRAGMAEAGEEPLPVPGSGFHVPDGHLGQMHAFLESGGIFSRSSTREISGVECAICSGQTDRHWLSSTGHAASRAPFSPTGMASAHAAVMMAHGGRRRRRGGRARRVLRRAARHVGARGRS
ncbi:MAG: hypothetical protein MPJ06_02725 [Nitrosopumilus sp.]|nr:hypothetical protein [Nitrosopumilus sp.]MDA7942911.1 hypothetical protein [Nitrosopumilus sp.]MDA7998424.1 hypothetical protein [Nitrosopumilus sp.]